MKKFKFKLEKVLKMKQNIEDLAKIEFAKVLQKKVAFEQEIASCNGCIADTQMLTSSYLENSSVDYKFIMQNDDYILALEDQIAKQQLLIEQLRPELEEASRVLQEAVKERKILEKLKERAHEKFLEEVELEETEMLDEISINMSIYNGSR